MRWGANDGPDDAFEQFNRWPELHALGASDEVRQLFERGDEGLLRQYTEARNCSTPSTANPHSTSFSLITRNIRTSLAITS